MQFCFLCSLSTKNTQTSFATCHVQLLAGLSLFGCMEVQPLLWGLKWGDLVCAPPDNDAEDLCWGFAVVDWDVFWWLSGEDGTLKTSLVKSSMPCALLSPLSVELDSTSDSAPKVVWCMVEGIVPLMNKTHFAGVAGGGIGIAYPSERSPWAVDAPGWASGTWSAVSSCLALHHAWGSSTQWGWLVFVLDKQLSDLLLTLNTVSVALLSWTWSMATLVFVAGWALVFGLVSMAKVLSASAGGFASFGLEDFEPVVEPDDFLGGILKCCTCWIPWSILKYCISVVFQWIPWCLKLQLFHFESLNTCIKCALWSHNKPFNLVFWTYLWSLSIILRSHQDKNSAAGFQHEIVTSWNNACGLHKARLTGIHHKHLQLVGVNIDVDA